jgi:Sulfatase-modifying factor enzyme 1
MADSPTPAPGTNRIVRCEPGRSTRGRWWVAGVVLAILGTIIWMFCPDATRRVAPRPRDVIPTLELITVATREKPFINSLGMEFVPVPITGGPTEGKRVLFCRWETRVKDYHAFANATGREAMSPYFVQGDEHPAVFVTWNDAKDFCAWLSQKEGFAYRLPSDHEWSCAVGIGDLEDPGKSPGDKDEGIDDAYPWGSQETPPSGAGNYADLKSKEVYPTRTIIDGYLDGFADTAPVGSFTANQWGICDLGGNVWEWCDDLRKPSDKARVIRGAAYGTHRRNYLLSSCRHGRLPTDSVDGLGFRVVVDGLMSGR